MCVGVGGVGVGWVSVCWDGGCGFVLGWGCVCRVEGVHTCMCGCIVWGCALGYVCVNVLCRGECTHSVDWVGV